MGLSEAERGNASYGAVSRTAGACLALAAPSSNPRVPDVRGYSPTLARRKLEAQGLAVASSTAISKGTVAEQSPAPETSVAPATVVRLIVR